jgi:transketolase
METKIAALKSQAYTIRASILHSLHAAKSGHLGGSLGMTDVFTALYFHVLNHRPNDPQWPQRDRLILSIGHIAPVLYATLAHAGYFPVEELKTLRRLETRLQGHPGRDHGLPGIELSAGSLGQGVGVSVGMALAARHLNQKHRCFCICGDGELQEGSVWEAAMSASHHQLDKLIWIIDRNQLQIDGKTSDVMEIEPLEAKFLAFGWQVNEIDGHDFRQIIAALDPSMGVSSKPRLIIANTTMGKGVPSIENNASWHGKAPNDKELNAFLSELY